jgi:NodT family efflux transporter outer membrane factor (OMF) lipoprotein
MEDVGMNQHIRARLERALSRLGLVGLAFLAVTPAGCTPLKQWIHNGLKVGPNFEDPPAVVAESWIDATDLRLSPVTVADTAWWEIFQDPAVPLLIETAYRENLDLKTVATRVLQAQAQRNIDVGNLFPQSQTAVADYAHAQISRNFNFFNNPRAKFGNQLNVWATGFNASWELDLWGRIRRMIEAADADVDASVESYRGVLVTLTADVAESYIQIRTVQERIAYARGNVEIQRGSLELAEARERDGMATALDVKQARSSLAQAESTVPPLVISLRQANNRLCVLLGQAPRDLTLELGAGPIPVPPPEVAAGIPAQLLEQRPDVRQALREAAAQSAHIGVAEADFYPRFGVQGFIGYAASDIRRLFTENSLTGFIFPTFSWRILNYGRVQNNLRNQDARFEEKVFQYQQTVLKAGREVEDALVAFLQYQLQSQSLDESVKAAQDSVVLVQAQYREGLVDFNRVFTTQSQLLTQQDQLAVSRGNSAASLVAVYRALGGGWQAFETGTEAAPEDVNPHGESAVHQGLLHAIHHAG